MKSFCSGLCTDAWIETTSFFSVWHPIYSGRTSRRYNRRKATQEFSLCLPSAVLVLRRCACVDTFKYDDTVAESEYVTFRTGRDNRGTQGTYGRGSRASGRMLPRLSFRLAKRRWSSGTFDKDTAVTVLQGRGLGVRPVYQATGS